MASWDDLIGGCSCEKNPYGDLTCGSYERESLASGYETYKMLLTRGNTIIDNWEIIQIGTRNCNYEYNEVSMD